MTVGRRLCGRLGPDVDGCARLDIERLSKTRRYELTEETRDLLSLLRSWTDVFPNAYLFETRAERTFLLVGFNDDDAIRQLMGYVVRRPYGRYTITQSTDGRVVARYCDQEARHGRG